MDQKKFMPNTRRDMLKMIAITGLSAAGISKNRFQKMDNPASAQAASSSPADQQLNLIGAYGLPLMALKDKHLPSLSFSNERFDDIEKWRTTARDRVTERIAMPQLGAAPKPTVNKQYEYDGLHIEELSWQLPYGAPTQAILLKPTAAKGPLPGILAFHDHGGNKYFGVRKITKTNDDQHPLMAEHQKIYYNGFAWANEVAKRGYVVLVSDAFTFGSRRVLLADVPASLRGGLTDNDPEDPKHIQAYNDWASEHEHTMAKSLFSAGTTWPGMFLAEDRIALDILCARPDVDKDHVGCGGLSGGGIRTVYMSGMDPRIKCAVTVGFMTTWNDFLLNKSVTHTWMTYVPLLPNELDFPEIMALRAPLPALALNNNEDDLFTLPEMKKAETILSAVYAKAGKPGQVKSSFYPGPHKFDKEMQAEAFNWFDRWLKK